MNNYRLLAIVALLLSICTGATLHAQEVTFDPPAPHGSHGIVDLVNEQIRLKNLPYPVISRSFPFVRSRNGRDWQWPGTEDTATLTKICNILGYKTYVRSTCYDDERSHRYPSGKCNFHSPSDNEHTFYDPHSDTFKWESANPKHAKTWVSTITCRDRLPQCSDYIDNDGDGKIDLQDPDCDGPDDDDEDRTRECEPGAQQHQNCGTGLNGICSAGRRTRTCNQDGWWRPYGSCVANIQPGDQNEQCSDGKDNDCDGRTDRQDTDCFECSPGERQHQSCGTGLNGVCAAGKRTRTCNNSGWYGPYGSCVANINPGQLTEQCGDGLDNDCDGRTDGQDSNCFQCTPGAREGKGCNTGLKGICSTGITERTCLNNGTWTAFGACRATTTPGTVTEICNDNLDNDCDGLTDGIDPQCAPADQCQQGQNESRDCSTGLPGVCGSGKQYRFCQYNKQWSAYGSCFATTQPGQLQEICGDQKDNDCDGLTDEQCHATPTPYPSTPTPTPVPNDPKVCSLSINISITKTSLVPDKLRDIANKAASHVVRRLGRAAKTRAVTNVMSYAEGAPELCNSLYSRAMGAVNDMPDQFYSCAAGSCGDQSFGAQHESYLADVTEMTKVTRKLSRGYNRSAGLKSRRMIRLRRNANKARKALTQALSLVPNITYHCN